MWTAGVNKQPNFPEKLEDATEIREPFGDQKTCQNDIALPSRDRATQVKCQEKTLEQDDRVKNMFDVGQKRHKRVRIDDLNYRRVVQLYGISQEMILFIYTFDLEEHRPISVGAAGDTHIGRIRPGPLPSQDTGVNFVPDIRPCPVT